MAELWQLKYQIILRSFILISMIWINTKAVRYCCEIWQHLFELWLFWCAVSNLGWLCHLGAWERRQNKDKAILADFKYRVVSVRRFEDKCYDRHGLTVVFCNFYEQSTLSLDYCCSKWEQTVMCGVFWLISEFIFRLSLFVLLISLNLAGSIPKRRPRPIEATSYGILQRSVCSYILRGDQHSCSNP